MLWQWSPGVITELAASAILLVLAIYLPGRDLNRQARLTGVTLVFVCALWILSHAIEIGFPVVFYKEALVGLQLFWGMLAMTFWLVYILHYLGPRKLLTRRIYILFVIMPVVAILALLTNNTYGLMWTASGLDSQNPYLPLQPTYGLIYWACMVYAAILTLTGSFLIIWNIFRRRYSYRRESIFLLIAAVLPLVTAFIEVMGLISDLKLSVGLSSWTACIGTIIIILNLPKLHSAQVIPIARDIVFERIGDCILVLDMQDRVLDLNPAAEQLIGYRISDAIGLSINKLWPYQSGPMMPFNEMAEAGVELVLERDGKQRIYALHISTINGTGRGVLSKVVLLTDITERKNAQESQHKEHLMLERTERVANIGSWEWNIATDTVTWSDELFSIFQRDRKEGAPSFAKHPAFYHPDDMERLKQVVAVAVADGTSYEIELRAIRKDGETRVCMARGVAEMGLNGRATHLFGSLQDITERKLNEEKLQRSYESLKKTLDDAVDTMAKIVETRDPYTAGHQQRVSDLANAIAREMKLEDTRVDHLRMAAVIHDIGKMYVPSEILSKPGKLSTMEFNLIKTHARAGYDIVKSMDFPFNVAETVFQHHERLDGSGYPNQLRGKDTLLEARILAVADVIEAMASYRPYRAALGIDKALEEISQNRGTLYDPDVVDACVQLFNSGRFEFKSV